MRHLILNIGVLLLMGILLSCEEEDRTYRGPQYYEFSAAENGQTNYRNILLKESSVIGRDTICVQLIKPTSESVQVNYRIADQLFYIKSKNAFVFDFPEGLGAGDYELYRTDAELETDYRMITEPGVTFDPKYGTGSIVVPAGEMFGYIPVEMLRKSGRGLYIVLEDSPDAMANRPTAVLNWQMAVDKVFYMNADFSMAFPTAWTTIDKDGDGYGWEFYKGSLTSDSYRSSTGPLTPENYLISPEVTFGDAKNIAMTFSIAASATGAYQEKYRVIISTQPITEDNCRNAEVLRDYTELTKEHSKGNFIVEQIDLSAYSGKTVYIGFVHGDCTDMEMLMLLNVNIYSY